ncbi:unnamed protein product [Wickerhamomyces anomalus]
MAAKRLMKEYSNIQKELDKNEEYQNIISLEPLNDLFNWKSTIRGPKGSPFEKGIWEIKIRNGEICLDILQAQWTPAWTLLSTMVAIILLLQDPEPNSPLNVDISNLLKNGDLKGYNGLIKYYTHKYALI